MAGMILIGLFAAYGFLAAAWTLAGMLRKKRYDGVLIVSGSGEDKLALMAKLLWLREMSLLECPIALTASGIDEVHLRIFKRMGAEVIDDLGAEDIDGTGNGNLTGHHSGGGVPEL